MLRMPALELLGRRWHVASDDFVIPEAFDVVFRSICLTIAGGIFWKNYATANQFCEGQFYIHIYFYGSFILTSLVICSTIALIFQSKSGSIVIDSDNRKYVPTFIICKWIIQIAEIALNITGAIWVIQKKLTCTLGFDVLLTGLVLSSWMLIFFRILTIYFYIDPIGGYKFTVKNNGEPDAKIAKEWQRKFLTLSFLLTGKPLLIKQALEEAGYLFGSLFEDTDLVVSDILAGTILLFHRESQIQSKQGLKESENLKNEKVLGMSREDGQVNSAESDQITANSSLPLLESWDSLPHLNHYLKYAMAAYTWSVLLLNGGASKMKDLWKEAICCGCLPCKRKPTFDIVGDKCCSLHSAALKSWKFENMEIIYADYTSTVYEVPFFVSVDHAKQAIVVSVRGTVFVNDTIVDTNATPYAIGVPGLPESFKIHHGILLCARLIKEKLDRLQLLPNLFATYPNHNLIFTGTSLGAGTATALSFMFKDAYPFLKCYSFSPPGGLLSADAVEYSKSFVISIVYGDDFIGRLSAQSLENVKYRIVDALSACRTPKYRIILGAISALWGGTPKFQYDKNSSFYKTYKSQLSGDTEKDTDFHIILNVESENQTESSTLPTTSNIITPVKKLQSIERMYPPGNILYVTETDSFQLGHKNPNYKGAPRWTIRWADKSEFSELVLTSRFNLDHFPFRLYRSLKYLSENC